MLRRISWAVGVALLPIGHSVAIAAPVATNVPEPASLGLLAVGAGALLVMRARKK